MMSDHVDNSITPSATGDNGQPPVTETAQPHNAGRAQGARRNPLEELPVVHDRPPDDDRKLSFPFTHATTFDSLERMLDAGVVRPNNCDVFGEELVYLFYGRFAYRIQMEENLNSLSNDGPVALIFKDNIAHNIHFKRVFPFDSGGYEQFYQSALGSLDLLDYQLFDLDHANKVICFCWLGLLLV
jgi:hypothetical protein